jgi:hypothetical protein
MSAGVGATNYFKSTPGFERNTSNYSDGGFMRPIHRPPVTWEDPFTTYGATHQYESVFPTSTWRPALDIATALDQLEEIDQEIKEFDENDEKQLVYHSEEVD